jgi:signal transduction histidine kinase
MRDVRDQRLRSRLRARLLGSARTRILLSFLVLLAVSTVVSTLALRQILLGRVGERVEQALVQEVDEFRTLAGIGRDPRTSRDFADLTAVFDVYLERNVPSAGEDLFTFAAGRLYRTTASPTASRRLVERIPSLGAVTDTVRGDVVTRDGTVRYLAVPVVFQGEEGGGAFAVTQNLGQEQAEVDQAVQVAAGVSLAVLAVASLLAYLVAGRVLAPLNDLTQTARAITETDLTRRIDVSGDDELARTARTFNAMLDRIQAAIDSQRAFVSDAGHELRTPITVIRGHLELLGEDPEERRETLSLVDDELDRMSRLVEDLLTLAKAERRDFLRYEEVDLDLFTEELFSKAEKLAPRRWTVEALGTGRITADRQRLTQAVMNLASNAVQHTAAGDPIALGSAMRDGGADFWVRDEGPGIPAADQERIFERFARAGDGRRRSDGAGLGLAIVDAIAEAHGGRVHLRSAPGAGATFTVHVPTTPPKEPTG